MSYSSDRFSQGHISKLFSKSPHVEAEYTLLRERLLATVAERQYTRTIEALSGNNGAHAGYFESPGLADYWEELQQTVIPGSVDLSSPLCMGHMTGALPHFAGLVSELVVLLNQNLVKKEASPALTSLEMQTLASLHQLVYRHSQEYYRACVEEPDSSLGLITSDGTLSNLTALWIARNLCLGPCQDFPGIEAAGMARALERYSCESAVVVGSRLMHYSISKAASLLGLGAENVLALPVDCSHRLEITALKDCIADCAAHQRKIIAVIGVAGTTECGSIDPLKEIAEIAGGQNLFFHVDAAWGGPLLFSEQQRPRLAGIERADSVVLDGHKQMYLPVAVSALLLRDPHSARVIEKQSRYMLQEGSGDLGRRSLEGSRSGAALFFHAGLHLIGAQGYAFLMEENLRKARVMADLVCARPEFELLVAPETNILLFRALPASLRTPQGKQFSVEENAAINSFNERLQKRQSQAGRTFVSRTTIEVPAIAPGVPLVALRAIVANPLLEEQHMCAVLDDLAGIMAELDQQQAQIDVSNGVFRQAAVTGAGNEGLSPEHNYPGKGAV